MITPLEAFELVQMQTQEHGGSEGGAGIRYTMAELGIDEEQLHAALPHVHYAQTMVNMPVPSQILGAFVAGALWRARAAATPAALRFDGPISDEMVDATVEVLRVLLHERGSDELSALRSEARHLLEVALNPAADPPTGDGVEGSS